MTDADKQALAAWGKRKSRLKAVGWVYEREIQMWCRNSSCEWPYDLKTMSDEEFNMFIVGDNGEVQA